MKHFSFSAFLVGVGFALIFSYFFVLFNSQSDNPEDEILNMPNDVIIQRAKELGLIDPTEGINKDSIKIHLDN